MKIGRTRKLFLLILGLILIWVWAGGCVQHHKITIDPRIPVRPSDLGGAKKVGLKVLDARPGNIIARWSGGFNVRGFTITPDADITETMRLRVREGLQTLGFQVKPLRPDADRIMKVEILRIKSHYHSKTPQLRVRVTSSLRATCQNRDNRYQQVFTDHKERNSKLPGGQFPDEKLVNASLSDLLRKMLSDRKLVNCLAH